MDKALRPQSCQDAGFGGLRAGKALPIPRSTLPAFPWTSQGKVLHTLGGHVPAVHLGSQILVPPSFDTERWQGVTRGRPFASVGLVSAPGGRRRPDVRKAPWPRLAPALCSGARAHRGLVTAQGNEHVLWDTVSMVASGTVLALVLGGQCLGRLPESGRLSEWGGSAWAREPSL